jgi:hypothetical protein
VLCWNFAVARLGVIIASLYLDLLPVIGKATAAAIGRKPTAMQLIGGAIAASRLIQRRAVASPDAPALDFVALDSPLANVPARDLMPDPIPPRGATRAVLSAQSPESDKGARSRWRSLSCAS